MALATINDKEYGRLLAHALPAVIQTERENERMIAELEALDSLGRPLNLIPVFGASSVVSDVLNGGREISKAHTRKPAEFFHVTPALFI